VFVKRAVRPRLAPGHNGRGAEGEDSWAQRLRDAHETHERALGLLHRILDDLDVSPRYVSLTEAVDASGFDLVVALGGDGTVLHASHQIGLTPVLAINSAPEHSVGFLTATTIDHAPVMIRAALRGELPSACLHRMAVDIEGRRVYGRVLNDVLYSHECPASTARYVLRLGPVEEEQMSSGIWIGTAAGSTAAIRSAGGRVMPPGSRRLQFVVREPYRRNGGRCRLGAGFVPPGGRLEVRNLTDAARLYVDGPHVMLRVRLGETVELSLSDEPLTLLGFRRART
jgi:NAD+ kinase